MRVRILAVGQHIADWAQEAVRGYLARFPRSWSVDLKEIRTEHRAGQTPAKLMQLEAERLLAAIEPGDFVVVLDEHGKDLTTVDLARQMHAWGSCGFRHRRTGWPCTRGEGCCASDSSSLGNDAAPCTSTRASCRAALPRLVN